MRQNSALQRQMTTVKTLKHSSQTYNSKKLKFVKNQKHNQLGEYKLLEMKKEKGVRALTKITSKLDSEMIWYLII